MAKAKAKEEIVETQQDNDFADPVDDRGPRGQDLQSAMDAIRVERARARALRGKQPRRRVLTNYHDAERLHNLATGQVPGSHDERGAVRDSFGRIIRGSAQKFPDIATAEELVEAEENGLLPNPEQYATGTTAPGGDVVEPDEVV